MSSLIKIQPCWANWDDLAKPLFCVNGNPADDNKRCAACWKWICFASKDKNLEFFLLFIGPLSAKPTFHNCRNTKTSQVEPSRTFLPKKGFWVVQPKPLDGKLWNNFFWKPNKSRSIVFKVCAAMLSIRIIPRRSSESSSSYAKNNVFWVYE